MSRFINYEKYYQSTNEIIICHGYFHEPSKCIFAFGENKDFNRYIDVLDSITNMRHLYTYIVNIVPINHCNDSIKLILELKDDLKKFGIGEVIQFNEKYNSCKLKINDKIFIYKRNKEMTYE